MSLCNAIKLMRTCPELEAVRIGGKTYDRATNAQTYKTFEELAAPVFSEWPIDKGSKNSACPAPSAA